MSLGTLPRPDAALTRGVGEGRLRLVAGVAPDGRTYLAERSQRFPLRLTRPLYLDPAQPGMAFLYVQNPSGGLFEDDDHRVELEALPDARVHLTTQAASKVYRAEMGCARQLVSLRVAPGAYAEYVPDALIPHAGARLASEVVADVEPGGAAIVCETVAPGRVARGEAFEYDRLSLVTRLSCASEQRAVDTLVLEPGRLDLRRAGMLGERGYVASLFAIAPERDAEALAAPVAQALADVPGAVAGTGTLPGGVGLLARILAPSGVVVRRALEAGWAAAREALLGTPPPGVRK
jgi:urease accessory protein